MDYENISSQLTKIGKEYDLDLDILMACVWCLFTIPLDGKDEFLINFVEKDRLKNKILRYMELKNEK